MQTQYLDPLASRGLHCSAEGLPVAFVTVWHLGGLVASSIPRAKVELYLIAKFRLVF